jgi:hypothetical protein
MGFSIQHHTLEKVVFKYPDHEPRIYFLGFGGYFEGVLRGNGHRGDDLDLSLSMNDIEKLTNIFVLWGTNYLINGDAGSRENFLIETKDLNRRLACAFAMFCYVLSFSAKNGEDLGSRCQQSNLDFMYKTDHHLRKLGLDVVYAARYFSSRIECSCIPSHITCDHSFPIPKAACLDLSLNTF